jgi:flagellar biosynthesis GTPase FlhF
MDVAGAQFAAVKEVDVQQTVDDLKASWVAQAKLDVDPSLVTLRLVACGSRKPSAAEEEAAVVLDDPSLNLAEARVTGTAWLLADTVQLALLAVERKEEAERQRAEREEEAERQRAEREEEAERQRAEREEEAERQRAEREEEAERQRAERRARRGAQHYPSSTS